MVCDFVICVLSFMSYILFIFFSPSTYSSHKISFSIFTNLLGTTESQDKASGVAWEVEITPEEIIVNMVFYLKGPMNLLSIFSCF